MAAKVIHHQIASPYNIHLFKREMDVAARIRHPNLLQFIGATQEGEMVILTELMPTSLRKELERKAHSYMSPDQVISIGLDVLRALNYLHQMRPHPLIHRDISSANVLLEPLSQLIVHGKPKCPTMAQSIFKNNYRPSVLVTPATQLLKPTTPPGSPPRWTSSALEFSSDRDANWQIPSQR